MSGTIVAQSFVDDIGDLSHQYNPWQHLKKNAAQYDPDLISDLKNQFRDLKDGPDLFEQFKSCRTQAVVSVLVSMRARGYRDLMNRVEQCLPNCLCP